MVETVEKPSKSDNKPFWVAYAVAQGMDEAEAEAMSKPALIAKFSDDDDEDGEASAEEQVEAAHKAGEAMTAPDAPPAVKSGAEDLPPHLRAAAFHRPIEG